MLQGRVGQAVKAREIFIFPPMLEDHCHSPARIGRAQAIVARPCSARRHAAAVAIAGCGSRRGAGGGAGALHRAVAAQGDRIEVVSTAELPADAPFVIDRKDG